MLTRLIGLTCGILFLAAPHAAQAAETIRVLTDRTESHLAPLFAHFEKTTGHEVEAVYVDKGLMARLQAQPTEADLIITKTTENMERARVEGLLQPIAADALDGIPEQFVDPDRMYVITSYRARGLFLSTDRVEEGEIATYMDLAKPAFKGRVAIRSGFHPYNMALFCQMAESEGIDYVREFLTGLKANLARQPKSNDRGQVQAIHDGIADVSVGNHYYLALMQEREDQRPWAESVRYLFPDQAGKGTYVLSAATGITTAERNVEAATELVDYLLDDFAQYYLANALHVFPVNPDLPVSAFNTTVGQVEGGQFKANVVSVRAADQHRDAVTAILTELDFDQ